VAQTRLPVFYRELAVPDTLEGRFLMLSLHLFAILHRLKAAGEAGFDLAQMLTDRFGEDMETVLREVGIGDLAIPKKMRKLATSSAGLLQAYEEALGVGEEALAAAISKVLPAEAAHAEATTERLTHYLTRMLHRLERQDIDALAGGEVQFPGNVAEELGEDEERC
jgi:cytochrome b pre-mRNA-processing protein 3